MWPISRKILIGCYIFGIVYIRSTGRFVRRLYAVMCDRRFRMNRILNNVITIGLIISSLVVLSLSSETAEPSEGLYKVEGKAVCPTQYTADGNWAQSARVIVDGGAHIGIVK